MNDKNKVEFQRKMIARQSEQIESLKSEIEKLKLALEEKDRVIRSVDSLRNELAQNVAEVKKNKEKYFKLVEDLRKMRKIIDQDVYNGKWKLVQFLIK